MEIKEFYERLLAKECRRLLENQMKDIELKRRLKEKENKMKVTVVKEVVKELENYWVIRAIKDNGLNKICVAECLCAEKPTEEEIGMFLNQVDASFCSVVENYRFKEEDEYEN